MSLLRSSSTPWIALLSGLSLTAWVVQLWFYFPGWAESLGTVSAYSAALTALVLMLISLWHSARREGGNHSVAWGAFLLLSTSSFIWQHQMRSQAFSFDAGVHSLWFGASLLPIWLWVAPLLLNAYFRIFQRRNQPPLRTEYVNQRHAPPLLKWLSFIALAVSILAWWYLAVEWFDPYYTYDDGLFNASAGPLMVSSTLLLAVGLAWIVQLIPYPDTGRSATLLMQVILATVAFLVALLAVPSGWPGALIAQIALLANAVLMGYVAGPVAHVEIRFLPGQSGFVHEEAQSVEGA